MTLRRLVRELLSPAPDPRPAYRRAESVEAALLADLRAAKQVVAACQEQLAARASQLGGRSLELLEVQLRSADREAERLAAVEQKLLGRIQAVSAHGRLLEARRSAAAVQVRVGEALAGISTEIDGFALELARAEQRADALEARAAAIDQLLDLEERP